MCEELSGESVFVSSKVNPPEASGPNCEREHELTTKCDDAELNYEQQPAEQMVKERFCYVCSKFGHTSRDCFDKIAKQLTKPQDGKDASKGSVELQFEAQNMREELSGESAVASSQAASLQVSSEQRWQRDEVNSYSLHGARERFWEQRMNVYYGSQPDANQHPSWQQMNPYNGFQPPNWAPPLGPPQPPNWGPPQPPNWGPIPPQFSNWGPPPVTPQPPNWSPPPIPPPPPPNWSPPPIPPPPPPPVPPQASNWGLPNPVTMPYYQYPPPFMYN